MVPNPSACRGPGVVSRMADEQQIRAIHDEAVRTGLQGYVDPDTGNFVFTGPRLLQTGRCCGNGCRHCPFPAAEQARAGRATIRETPS